MTTALRITTKGANEYLTLGDESLTQLQDAVGGYVEAVRLTDDIILWCNGDGKVEGLPRNKMATLVWMMHFGQTDVIVGDVVFTGPENEEGNLTSLQQPSIDFLLGILSLTGMVAV